jgi:protein CWC15
LRRAEQEYYEEKEGGASTTRLIRQDGENVETNKEKQKLMAEAERLSKLDKEDGDRESDSDGSSSR